MNDPISGPVPREEFKRIAALPSAGAAKLEIRQYDPLWNLAPGEKVRFRVRVRGTMKGTAYVTASSQEEADKLADNLKAADIDWNDYDNDDFDILTVDAERPRKPLLPP